MNYKISINSGIFCTLILHTLMHELQFRLHKFQDFNWQRTFKCQQIYLDMSKYSL